MYSTHYIDMQKIKEHSSCGDNPADKKKNIHLRDCLKLFTEKETLSKDDAWYMFPL